jgi:hypothetical protein
MTANHQLTECYSWDIGAFQVQRSSLSGSEACFRVSLRLSFVEYILYQLINDTLG